MCLEQLNRKWGHPSIIEGFSDFKAEFTATDSRGLCSPSRVTLSKDVFSDILTVEFFYRDDKATIVGEPLEGSDIVVGFNTCGTSAAITLIGRDVTILFLGNHTSIIRGLGMYNRDGEFIILDDLSREELSKFFLNTAGIGPTIDYKLDNGLVVGKRLCSKVVDRILAYAKGVSFDTASLHKNDFFLYDLPKPVGALAVIGNCDEGTRLTMASSGGTFCLGIDCGKYICSYKGNTIFLANLSTAKTLVVEVRKAVRVHEVDEVILVSNKGERITVGVPEWDAHICLAVGSAEPMTYSISDLYKLEGLFKDNCVADKETLMPINSTMLSDEIQTAGLNQVSPKAILNSFK